MLCRVWLDGRAPQRLECDYQITHQISAGLARMPSFLALDGGGSA